MFFTYLRRLFHQPPRTRQRRLRPQRFRPLLEPLESRLSPAVYKWQYNGGTPGDFNVAANWMPGTIGQPLPGPDDTIQFDATGTGWCETPPNITLEIGRLLMLPGYTGTLYLAGGMNVLLGDSNLEAGNILQPNGATSRLSFGTGTVIWRGTSLNDGATVSKIRIGSSAELSIQTNAVLIGSNLENAGTVRFSTNLNQNVSFLNDAGINNENGSVLLFEGQRGISTSGTGVILNNGYVEKPVTAFQVFPTVCDLPLINNEGSRLLVRGLLEFTRAGQQNGVSVLQNAGILELYENAQLTVEYGYVQNGGYLHTFGGGSSDLHTGSGTIDVQIHGGEVWIGADATYSRLSIIGHLTMDGGTWRCFVDGTTMARTQIDANGITLGGSSSLVVTTNNIPEGGIPAGTSVRIMHAGLGTISGNFASIDLGGVWSSTSVEGGNKSYYLNKAGGPDD